MANCLNCGKEVKNKFCNTSCENSYYARLKRERYFSFPSTCSCCGKELDWSHRKNKYCNSSCAAKINNKGVKRNYKRETSVILQSYTNRVSDENFKQISYASKNLTDSTKIVNYEDLISKGKQKIGRKKSIKTYTKGEIFSNHKNRQSARSNIRKDAERTFKRFNRKYECCLCEYNNHIEIAHIKPVSEFTNDTFISEINHISNLVPLCPNHHWEFDHHKLSEIDLNRIKEYSAMDQ